jgi:hypothetical protein
MAVVRDAKLSFYFDVSSGSPEWDPDALEMLEIKRLRVNK